jgi:type 2A phosphatase activator TIP41
MPCCWFVLLRFWLRVDHVMLRLRETRLFCRFDRPELAGTLLREVKHHEGLFEELVRGGAPPEGSGAYRDAESAAAALQAVMPVGVKVFRVERLVVEGVK